MTLYKHDLKQHPDDDYTYGLNEVFYIIIENQNALSVTCVQDFDLYDYDNIVSRYGFNSREIATKYGRHLASKHSKQWVATEIELLD